MHRKASLEKLEGNVTALFFIVFYKKGAKKGGIKNVGVQKNSGNRRTGI